HRDEIVVRALPVFAQGGLVPRGPVFTAAANVGQDVDSAALKPQFAADAKIARSHRGLEAAVAVDQRRVRAIDGHSLFVDDEVGNFGSVTAGDETLFADKRRGIEAELRLLDEFGFGRWLSRLAQQYRSRRQKIRVLQNELIAVDVT